MKKLLMIMAMVAVIGMAGAQSAFAEEMPVAGTGLDFFVPASWQDGSVPDVNSHYAIRFGQGISGNNSMIYDPVTTGDPLVYAVGTNATTGDYSILGPSAGDSYTVTQESGDVAWGYRSDCNWRNFQIAANGHGTYVMNDGIARFDSRGVRVLPSAGITGLFDQNGGAVIITPDLNPTQDYGLWMGADGGGIYSLAAGTVQTTGLLIDGNGVFNFEAGSTGVLYVLTSGRTNSKTKAEIEALIAAGDIVDLGGETILVTELVAGDYAGHTEVKLASDVVPEPAGLGLLGLALLAVRRKRS